MGLTLDDILKLDDLRRETVAVPEWGGEVEVRELTAAEKLEIGAAVAGKDQSQMSPADMANLMITAAAYGLGANKNQVAAVGGKSYAAIERVANKVLELSGMGTMDKTKKKSG
jgi:hypothetical protein